MAQNPALKPLKKRLNPAALLARTDKMAARSRQRDLEQAVIRHEQILRGFLSEGFWGRWRWILRGLKGMGR